MSWIAHNGAPMPKHAKAGDWVFATMRNIQSGQYGAVIVEWDGPADRVRVRLDRAELTAEDLRSAAMVFSQLAEVLDDLD